jgi:hypothetical protein
MCFHARERVDRFMAISITHPWHGWSSFSNDWRFWYQALLIVPGLGTWIQRRRPGFIRYLLGLGIDDPSSTWAPGEREHYVALAQDPRRAPHRRRCTGRCGRRKGSGR